jgi:hypothetical protein
VKSKEEDAQYAALRAQDAAAARVHREREEREKREREEKKHAVLHAALSLRREITDNDRNPKDPLVTRSFSVRPAIGKRPLSVWRVDRPLFLDLRPDWQEHLYQVHYPPNATNWYVRINSHVLGDAFFEDPTTVAPFALRPVRGEKNNWLGTLMSHAWIDCATTLSASQSSSLHWNVLWKEDNDTLQPYDSVIELNGVRDGAAKATLICVHCGVEAYKTQTSEYKFKSSEATNHRITAFLSRPDVRSHWTLTLMDPNAQESPERFRLIRASLDAVVDKFVAILQLGAGVHVETIVHARGLNINKCVKKERVGEGICYAGNCLMLLLLAFSPRKFASGADALKFMLSTADALVKGGRADKFVRAVIKRGDGKHRHFVRFLEHLDENLQNGRPLFFQARPSSKKRRV